MAHLAQTYVHLRPYELNAEIVQRLGAAIQESAEAAARRFYRGDVTIDVDIEEGSGRFWATVYGGITALHIGYGVVADYKGFKESVAEIVQDARWFGDYMIDAVTHQAKASDKQLFRTERRLQTPGKLKRVTEKLEKLEHSSLNAEQMNEQLEAITREIEQIEKDLTEEEQKGFHTLLLNFENLPPLKPEPQKPREFGPDLVAIRPQIAGASPSRALVSGAVLPPRDVGFQLRHPHLRREPLTFRSTVYVPPFKGGDDDKGFV